MRAAQGSADNNFGLPRRCFVEPVVRVSVRLHDLGDLNPMVTPASVQYLHDEVRAPISDRPMRTFEHRCLVCLDVDLDDRREHLCLGNVQIESAYRHRNRRVTRLETPDERV